MGAKGRTKKAYVVALRVGKQLFQGTVVGLLHSVMTLLEISDSQGKVKPPSTVIGLLHTVVMTHLPVSIFHQSTD